MLFMYSGGFLHFGILAVLIFFGISGFLVTPGLVRSGNVIDYATHRALRIFPALAVVVVASMMVLGPVLTTAAPVAYFFDPRVYLYGKNILTLTYEYLPGVVSRDGQPAIINGALWTLHFEILSYIALAIMSLAGVLRKPYAILAVFLAIYGLYLAVNFESGVLRWFPGRFVTFVNLFVYFAAGATLYVFRSRIPYSVPLAAFALALLMVALAFGAGAVVLPLCLPYITIVAGLSVLPGRSLVSRDLSYGIYLIHAPVLVGVNLLYPGVLRWWMAAVVVFFIALTSSYLSWTFVEAPALARKKAVSNWANDRLRGIKMTLSRGLARPCRKMIVRDSRLEESLRSSVGRCPGPRRGRT
jgi:peptidoglycan/LPS O-acetylase OafA/YrhL